MRPDLQGLEITQGELRRLSGVNMGQVWRRSILRDPSKRSRFLWGQITEIVTLTLLSQLGFVYGFTYGAAQFNFGWGDGYILAAAIATGAILATAIQGWRIRRRSTQPLISLLDDVDRYNTLIQAIDINDQLEAAGNRDVRLSDRHRVIEALKLTRIDLVRALKTERILREHQQFIARNPQLFENNLMALAALQVNESASEHGRLLDEALQIGLSVQEEMRKLQDCKQ